MTAFPHDLDRTIVIHARPATVFEFFTRVDDWAAWWGAGSRIDARPGGEVLIRHPNGVEVTGQVIDIEPPSRIVFSYGYASGQPIPPGGSRVTIQLDGHPAGTLLRLRHEFTDAGVRDQHVQGWRYQLSVFANGVANRVNSAAADTVDRWFAAWSDPDAGSRERALGAVAARGITVHDRFSCIEGDEDLRAHLAAVHRFMPGLRLERRGEIRHCQWRVLADWAAVGADGQEKGRGTNVFVLDADGRIADIAGFWT